MVGRVGTGAEKKRKGYIQLLEEKRRRWLEDGTERDGERRE
jgi:hypothetical protein